MRLTGQYLAACLGHTRANYCIGEDLFNCSPSLSAKTRLGFRAELGLAPLDFRVGEWGNDRAPL